MGCRWKTVGGKRVREDRVSGPVSMNLLASFSIGDLLAEIKARMISGSPTVTAEELRDATFRLFLNPETGYWLEIRRGPGFPPAYQNITQAEATRLEAHRPEPSFIARMFHWPEIPDN